MLEAAVYDTKPYDEKYLSQAPGASDLSLRFHKFRLSADTAITAAGRQAICVFVNDCLDRPCLESLAKNGTQLIALRCAGFNNVDLPTAEALGIRVTRVPAYSPHAVAEHAVGLLLTLNRKIHRAYNRVREHNFSLNGLIGFDVAGKTIGIIGTGKIGKIAAQIFRGFEAHVLAYDPFPNQAWADSHGVRYTTLAELLPNSDVISLHLPLLPETRHLLNSEAFQKMKHGAVLVNTSRGQLIETSALLSALRSGQLGGVALDVYEEEEGVFFEDLSEEVSLDDELLLLLSFPNVLITSHQAFLTHEALSEIARVTIENMRRLDSNQPFLDGTILK